MSAAPTDLVAEFLGHTSHDQVEDAANRLAADDATHVSLKFDNPELERTMPWTGTPAGRQAFIDTFSEVASWWQVEDFKGWSNCSGVARTSPYLANSGIARSRSARRCAPRLRSTRAVQSPRSPEDRLLSRPESERMRRPVWRAGRSRGWCR